MVKAIEHNIRHSKANIAIYIKDITNSRASFRYLRDINISNFLLENLGQGREEQHSQRCHAMANINLY